MPPRLLSDESVTGPTGNEARSYGFIDTVHGDGGKGSVWTQNRFCNQYAAMPSLHFGYSLLIGLTILTLPLAERRGHRRSSSGSVYSISLKGNRVSVSYPSWKRIACVVVGIAYPAVILIAILATANHFILDAVAGACVCGVAWWGNGVLLNLLPVEDWFLWCFGFWFPEEDGERQYERDGVVVERETVIGKGVIS